VSVSKGEYRYGMNTQEKDNEIYGEGNSYSAEYWQYDARLGRRWNVDPKDVPSFSPYSCFANNPIWFSDVAGDSPIVVEPPTRHKIQKGETLSVIAKQSGTSVTNLVKWNNIKDPNKIYAGEELIVSDPTSYKEFSNQKIGETFKKDQDILTFFGDDFDVTVDKSGDWDKLEALSWFFDVLTFGYSTIKTTPPRTKGFNKTAITQSNNVLQTSNTLAGGNRITQYSYRGTSFKVQSSHGYDRTHSTGLITRKVSFQEVETTIIKNAYTNRLSIPQGKPGVQPFTGKITVGGQNIGYTATKTNSRINIGTYYPVK